MDINEQIQHTTYFVCKACKLEKKRIAVGRYPDGKDPRFVDESMSDWNGRMCPTCHKMRMAVRMKALRAKKAKERAKRRAKYARTGK